MRLSPSLCIGCPSCQCGCRPAPALVIAPVCSLISYSAIGNGLLFRKGRRSWDTTERGTRQGSSSAGAVGKRPGWRRRKSPRPGSRRLKNRRRNHPTRGPEAKSSIYPLCPSTGLRLNNWRTMAVPPEEIFREGIGHAIERRRPGRRYQGVSPLPASRAAWRPIPCLPMAATSTALASG